VGASCDVRAEHSVWGGVVWLVADGEKGTAGWFGVREKYRWLVADKPSEQGARLFSASCH
jgi:hypothetical protein